MSHVPFADDLIRTLDRCERVASRGARFGYEGGTRFEVPDDEALQR